MCVVGSSEGVVECVEVVGSSKGFVGSVEVSEGFVGSADVVGSSAGFVGGVMVVGGPVCSVVVGSSVGLGLVAAEYALMHGVTNIYDVALSLY